MLRVMKHHNYCKLVYCEVRRVAKLNMAKSQVGKM